MVKMKESEAEDSIDFCVYVEICFKVLLSCKRVEDKSEEKMYMLDQFSNGENSWYVGWQNQIQKEPNNKMKYYKTKGSELIRFKKQK